MFAADPRDKSGLAASYNFAPSNITQGPDGKVGRGGVRVYNQHIAQGQLLHCLTSAPIVGVFCPRWWGLQGTVEDLSGGFNHLMLGGDAPTWMYSTAPLATPEGKPVAPPTPGTAGHALLLSDQQVGCCAAYSCWCIQQTQLQLAGIPCGSLIACCAACGLRFTAHRTLQTLHTASHCCTGADAHQLQQLSVERADARVLDAVHRCLPQGSAIFLRHWRVCQSR